MSSLVNSFRRQAGPLLPDQCRIVVAVSGGADSMGLLHLLVASGLRPSASLLVAHFDHGLRVDSADDARFVVAEANRLGLACVVGHWEEGRTTSHGGLAARARAARYHFLWECAQRFGATRVVTGHHRDDQAETFLERLLRGSGVHGLSAMATARPLVASVELVRPLLGFSRAEIQAWLVAGGLSWREDASNQKLTARRNRIRHQGLPCLQTMADAGLSARLAATAERMAQADAALEWMLERLWPEWDPCRLESGGLSLAAAALLSAPDELLCRCLHRCHRQWHGQGQPPGARAVAGFVRLLRSRRRQWFMVVQGLAVQRRQERVLFHPLVGVAARGLGKGGWSG
ncbi:MAG: tRNA lysidine(34) synthetase TilS [Magnetococcales bacterium]|nr:tRNA lysidine(34) synthetase TilS [Magnetococcales bacterium]